MIIGELIATIKADTAQFERSMKNTVSTMKRTGDAMKGIGKQMSLALSVPLAGLGIAAVKAGADFEKSMNQFAAVSKATADQLKVAEKAARDLGKSTKFSAKEAADGATLLAMAGFSVEKSVAALPGVLSLASSGNMELAESADIVSNIMSGFGISADKTNATVDVLAATFTNANTNLSQLGEAMSYAAPIMDVFNQTLTTSSTAIGVLSDAGIQGSRAGAGLGQIMTMLSKKSTELGINMKDSSGNIKPLFDIIEDIEKQGISSNKIIEILGQRAGPAMAVLLKKGSTALREFDSELQNSEGTAKRVSNTQMKGLTGAFTEFKSALSELGIAFSKAGINSFLEQITDSATGLVLWMSNLSDTTKNFITITGGIIIALGPVTTVLGMLVSSILPKVIGLIGGLSTAFKVLTSVIIANPIGAAVTALALLGAGIALYMTRTTEATKRQQEYNEVSKEATKDITKQKTELSVLQDQLRRSSENIDRLKNSMVGMQKGTADYTAKSKALREEETRRSEIINTINSNYGEFLQNNIDTADSYTKIAGELTKVNNLLDQQIKKQALQAITADIMGRLVGSQQEMNVLMAKQEAIQSKLDKNMHMRASAWFKDQEAKMESIGDEISAEKTKYKELLNEYEKFRSKLDSLMSSLDKPKEKTTLTDTEKAAKTEESRLAKLKEATDLYSSTIAQMNKELRDLENQFKLYGDSVDIAGGKQQILNRAMMALMPTFAPTSNEVQGLKKQFDSLESVAVLQVFDDLNKKLKVTERDFSFLGDTQKRNEDQINAIREAYSLLIGNVAATDSQIQSLVNTLRTLEGINVGTIQKIDSLSVALSRLKEEFDDSIRGAIIPVPTDENISSWMRFMETLQNFQSVFAPIIGGLQNVLGSVSSLFQAQENAMIDSLEKRAEMELWTEERLAKEKEKVYRDFARKKKAIDLSQAIINTALGITSAFVPYIPGLSETMAGLVAAAGGIQIAAIQAQPLAKGGIVPDGYPNDNYPARLTSGEMVIPAKKLPDLKGGNFDDSRIVKAIMDKKEMHFDISENGIKVTSKKGNDYITHIQRSYRD